MAGTRKIAAILVADIVGYSRLAGADEDRTLSRLRGLRSDLIDPAIDAHHGRIVKRTGDGSLIEFRSVVDAVRCAIEVQNGLVERNSGLPPERRIEFRVGIHLGDVVEESDGDLMGDGVNIAVAARGRRRAGRDLSLRGRLSSGEGAARSRCYRSRPDPTQEHCRADPGLFAASRRACRGEASRTDKAFFARAARVRVRGVGHIGRSQRLVFLWREPTRDHRDKRAVRRPPAAHLSIVVLPFKNLSGDPSQDYFADGITENLTTDLSRIRNSFVIANSTANTYKGKAIDAKEIGKVLGVRFVLEGSVNRDQNRVRVNAQLVDAESGAHLWADRSEEDVADLFKLQDQVVARLATALGFELVKAEAERSARSSNPDALDLAMRGWATMWQSYPQPVKEKRDSHYAALALFDQALKIDPNDADALAGEAFTYMALFVFGEATTETDLDTRIIDQADRAIALDPDNMRAYVAKSLYLAVTGRANEALRAADSGLAINPNYASLLDARTLAETALGRFEQAKSDAQQAMRLSPRDPEIANRRLNLGMAELGLGHFDAAIVEYQKGIDAGDHSFIPYVNLAAAYALEGKMDEAKVALSKGRRLNPKPHRQMGDRPCG